MIRQLTFNGTELRPNNSFGQDGFLTLSAGSGHLPLPAAPPVGHLRNNSGLTLLYPAGISGMNGAMLAHLPLDGEGTDYDTAPVPAVGQPVFMTAGDSPGSYGVWMHEKGSEGDVLHQYETTFSSPASLLQQTFNLELTEYPDAPVIGLGADNHWLYIARRDATDTTNVTVERMDRTSGQLDNWYATLDNIPVAPVDAGGLSYNLLPEGRRLDFIPRNAVAIEDQTATPRAVTVRLPEYGGCGEWSELDIFSITTPIRPEPATRRPEVAGSVAGTVLGASVLATMAVGTGCAIKHRKIMKNYFQGKKQAWGRKRQRERDAHVKHQPPSLET